MKEWMNEANEGAHLENKYNLSPWNVCAFIKLKSRRPSSPYFLWLGNNNFVRGPKQSADFEKVVSKEFASVC